MQRANETYRRYLAGEKLVDIAKSWGVTHQAVSIYLKRGMENMKDENKPWRDEHIAELYDLRLEIEAAREPGKPLPLKAIDKLLRLLDLDIKLKGTAAPSRSIQATVPVNTTIQYRFLERSHGLSEAQIEQVFEYMASLPREQTVIDLTGFVKQKALPKPLPQEESNDEPAS